MSAQSFASFVLTAQAHSKNRTTLNIDPNLDGAIHQLFKGSKYRHIEVLRYICMNALPDGFLIASTSEIATKTEIAMSSVTRIQQLMQEAGIIQRYTLDSTAMKRVFKKAYMVNWSEIGYLPCEKFTGFQKLAELPFKNDSDKVKALRFLDEQNALICD